MRISYHRYAPLLLAIAVVLAGCSAQSKQIRQSKKYSKQNVQRQQNKKPGETLVGPGEVPPGDVNYKDLEAIRHRCVYVEKSGERCTGKAVKDGKYCRKHMPSSKY